MLINNDLLLYDKIGYMLSVNIYSLNKERETINIYGLDLHNPEHRWFLNVAIQCTSLYGKRLRVEGGFWMRLKIWLKNRKKIRIPLKAPAPTEQDKTVSQVLEFMRPVAAQMFNRETFNFEEIEAAYKEL